MKLLQSEKNSARYLVHFLVQTYFQNLNSILIMYDSNIRTSISNDYMDGITDALKTIRINDNIVFVTHWIDINNLNDIDLNDLYLKNIELGSQGYITILSNTSKFIDAKYYATENSVIRLMDKRFLFLCEDENSKILLRHPIIHYYHSHIMILPNKNTGDFYLFTQKWTGIKDNEKVQLIDIYKSRTFLKNSNLYPNKIKNMKGRTIKVSSIMYKPYVVSHFVKPGTGNVDALFSDTLKKSIFYDGSESQIVLEYCKLRNCTVKIVPYGNDQWGLIYENKTSDGMVGSVYRKETDFGIGSYYNWYNDEFEVSVPIAKSAVTLLSPAPSRYPAYLTIILPFSSTVWIFILLSILISSIVLFVIRFHMHFIIERNKNNLSFNCFQNYMLSLLNIFAIFFQQSISQERLNRFASRFFYASLLISAITLENSYSGNLKSILTVPIYTDPIDTAKKFAISNLKWSAPVDAWVLTLQNSDISYEKILTKNFQIRNYKDLRQLTFSRKYGFSIERLTSGSFQFGSYIQQDALSELIILKDDLYFEYTRGFSVRGWPIMEDINMFILYILQHGLFLIWERKAVTRYMDNKTEQGLIYLNSRTKEKPKPIVINVSHISGTLYFLFFGYAFSTILLIFEIILFNIKKKFFTTKN